MGPLAPNSLGGMTDWLRVVLVSGADWFYAAELGVEVGRDSHFMMGGHALGVKWQGVGQRSGRASGVAFRARKVKGFCARTLRGAFVKFRLGKNTSWAAHRL